MAASGLIDSLGKGPGFFAIALVEVLAGAFLAWKGDADLSGLALVIGAVNAGLFGGGAWKAAAEAKAGNGLPR